MFRVSAQKCVISPLNKNIASLWQFLFTSHQLVASYVMKRTILFCRRRFFPDWHTRCEQSVVGLMRDSLRLVVIDILHRAGVVWTTTTQKNIYTLSIASFVERDPHIVGLCDKLHAMNIFLTTNMAKFHFAITGAKAWGDYAWHEVLWTDILVRLRVPWCFFLLREQCDTYINSQAKYTKSSFKIYFRRLPKFIFLELRLHWVTIWDYIKSFPYYLKTILHLTKLHLTLGFLLMITYALI